MSPRASSAASAPSHVARAKNPVIPLPPMDRQRLVVVLPTERAQDQPRVRTSSDRFATVMLAMEFIAALAGVIGLLAVISGAITVNMV